MSVTSYEQDHAAYLAHGGRLHAEDHAEIMRRTTSTIGKYTPHLVTGILRARTVAERLGLVADDVNDAVATTYHFLHGAYETVFQSGDHVDERAIMRDALAMHRKTSLVVKLS
ncbi:MAG: hypothetical protein ACP5NS_01160 [Candidatus Pacearchaeota archaeon]